MLLGEAIELVIELHAKELLLRSRDSRHDIIVALEVVTDFATFATEVLPNDTIYAYEESLAESMDMECEQCHKPIDKVEHLRNKGKCDDCYLA